MTSPEHFPTSFIIAHRGYSARAPENTLVSFRMAIEAGAPAAECDVHRTRDGHIVLSHDATVDRCTDGTGAIAEMTLAQVQSLDAGSWKGEQYRGERIPTLADTLALTVGKLRLMIEIKQAGIVEDVVAVVRGAAAVGQVSVISFDAETCRQTRLAEPLIPVGFLSGGVKSDDPAEAEALLNTALGAHCQFVSLWEGGITDALIARSAQVGLAVWGWTVNDPGQVKDLARRGVTGITTDEAGMGLVALGTWRQPPAIG